MNKTYPKCGADYNGKPARNQRDFWCGSTTWNDGDFYQSPECVRRERDQLEDRNRELVERIKLLEEARTNAAANSLANMLAYEDAEKKIAALVREGDQLAKIVLRDYRGAFCEAWEKVKEAKP